jgi:hypothetical protein
MSRRNPGAQRGAIPANLLRCNWLQSDRGRQATSFRPRWLPDGGLPLAFSLAGAARVRALQSALDRCPTEDRRCHG